MPLNSFGEVWRVFGVIAVELTGLFLLVSFAVALLQEYVPISTIQSVLLGRGLRGNIIGATLGGLTPFCSCSTIPITMGLLNAGAPFGATMSFLLASPTMNPVIIGLIIVLFGWQIALFYGLACFVLAIGVGATWQALRLDRYVKNVRVTRKAVAGESPDLRSRWQRSAHAALQTFKGSAPYLLIGAAVGALIYGIIPEAWIAAVAGPENRFAVPAAAIIGVPLYIRAETLIPIGLALHSHGMSLGAVMALVVAGAGASIPEITMLNRIFRPRLVAAFLVTIFGVAIVTGYIANMLFS